MPTTKMAAAPKRTFKIPESKPPQESVPSHPRPAIESPTEGTPDPPPSGRNYRVPAAKPPITLKDGGNAEKARDAYVVALRETVEANAREIAQATVRLAMSGNATAVKELNSRILDSSFGAQAGDLNLDLLSDDERTEFMRLLEIARVKRTDTQSGDKE